MSLVDDFFQTPIPETLFHYTAVKALEGILSSHTMWCTDAAYMNDSTELTHALPYAKSALETSVQVASVPIVQKTLRSLVSEEYSSGFLSQSKSQYFLMCFTVLPDDLPQWRSYADDANGVSLAFDLRGLRPPSDADTMVTFAPCIYDDDVKAELLQSLLSDFLHRHEHIGAICDSPREMAYNWALWQINNPSGALTGFKACFPKSLITASITKFRVDLVRLCCHFKSHHFSSEREWRLVLPHMRSEPFRSTVMREVAGKPIVEFTFQGFQRSPITGVKLGAGADEARVQSILDEYGYTVPLTRSSVPYRPRIRN